MPKKKKPAMLTVSEFIKLAADRGTELWTFEEEGVTFITNGARKYPLPLQRSGYVPVDLVEDLCFYFFLPYLDFTLDPRGDD